MSGDKIKSLVELANNRLNSSEDFEQFQTFVSQELDLDTIYSLIDEKIEREDGPKVLEYILVGLSVKPDSQKTIENVYEYVLNAINIAEIPEKMKVCLISRLSLELNKLSTKQLIKFINMCKKDIEESNEKCVQSWKELLPHILKIVSEIKLIRTEEIEMTGADYKEMIITDICRFKVQPNISVALALMFRGTLLTEKEHELVIKTLCSYFGQMKPQEIPPILQQILHFCLSGDFLTLFCTLQKYFDDKYHLDQSNDENFAFEIEGAGKKEFLEAESTVLFLLEDFAKVHSSFVNDITKYIKNSIGAPNMVFGPFMLAFLLTMSCCAPFEANVIDLIKKLVVQSLVEVENTKRSYWLKLHYTDIYDVYSQFQIFIKSEISSYEKIFKGLVNLGLSFLGTTSSVFKKNAEIINTVHQLGLFIIVSLVHKRSFITGSVLRKLTNFITSNPESNQYLECLHKLCKNQKSTVIENNTEILKLFKEIPVGMTDKVTCAVMPVLKTSTYLRDNIIMILRKELISKDYQLRHCAVLGFIEILCSVHLDSYTTLSQNTNSQDSWPGLFTQMVLDRDSVDIHSAIDSEDTENNKTICLEILDSLKTCFYQKSEIKQSLYRGLIRVISHNNELCVYVNSLLLDHMSSWCNRLLVAENKKSLKFDKSIVIGKDNKPIVLEPLDELILLAQHVLVTNIQFNDNNDNNDYTKIDELKQLLCQLVNFYSDCNTDEIKVNENDCLLDIISDTTENKEVIKQILCVYQALMVYIVNSWLSSDQDKECCKRLQKLFSKYSHILEAVMASDKTNKKKDKGNKKNKTESTGAVSKFVEPAIHLDFDVLYKFLSLLAKNVNWASELNVVLLKQNVSLWEFVLKLVQTHLIEVKNLLSRDIKPRNLYENICKLTKLLYDYFLFDVCEKIKFSQTVLELGLDCYLQTIKIVNSYYKNLNKFFSDSNQDDSNEESGEIFNVLRNMRLYLDQILQLNKIDDDSNEQDDNDDKETYDTIESHLIGCMSVVCHGIKNNQDSKIKNILTWLSTVAEKYTFSNSNNSKQFLTLMLEMHSANQEDPIMLATTIKNLCHSFGRISKSHKANQSQMRQLRLITNWNRAIMCPVLCQNLCNELNYVVQCLSRIKAELNASQKKIKLICQDRLKSREKAICHRIVLVVLSATSFTKTVIPLGQCTESVFNLLYQLYRTINIVIKHFLTRSTVNEPIYKQALLTKLSEIVNVQLSPNVSKFIMFIEYDRPLTDKEKKSAQLKNQTRRQASYIPRVVTELELFVNLITKLGKKMQGSKFGEQYQTHCHP
uniref:Fanconi anemia group I n=1 Tax=Melanaphis sacchari TaxID=742174 RepID=A0A2H8TUM8_9HEMI